jgi:hypothetical protein
MKITEENDWKIVLTDESGAGGLIWFIIIVGAGWTLATSLYATGMIPGTAPYEAAVELGRHPGIRELLDITTLFYVVGGPVVGLLYVFLRTYPVVVLDKARGKFVLQRVRRRTRNSRTIREVELKQVRCARIGDHENLCRLEFELTSGELLAPNRGYSSNYDRSALFALVEKINKFLRVNLEVSKDAERSVSRP